MKKEVLTWEGLDKLVQDATKRVISLDVDNIYGIPRGGVIPAVMLSYKTGLPLVKKPTRNTLIVDDICDSGKTFKQVTAHITLSGWKSYMFMADTPFRTLSLFKRHSSTFDPDITLVTTYDDRWIVFPWEDINDAPKKDGTNITT